MFFCLVFYDCCTLLVFCESFWIITNQFSAGFLCSGLQSRVRRFSDPPFPKISVIPVGNQLAAGRRILMAQSAISPSFPRRRESNRAFGYNRVRNRRIFAPICVCVAPPLAAEIFRRRNYRHFCPPFPPPFPPCPFPVILAPKARESNIIAPYKNKRTCAPFVAHWVNALNPFGIRQP